MFYLAVKSMVSGILVMIISEIARRNASFGALVASLPLISLLGMVWLWHDTHDTQKMASHAAATFWYVLPSLPMFLLLPCLLRQGIGFYTSLLLVCSVTVMLYFLMVWILHYFHISL